jgi:O-antigen/teichoic acid export membrane protein
MRVGAAWVVGSRILGILATLVAQIALARLLPPAEFGGFTLLVSVAAFAGGVAAMGLNGAMMRFVPESLAQGNPRRAADALRMGYGLAVLGWMIVGAAVVISWPQLTNWLGLPAYGSLLLFVVGSLGALALMNLTADSLRSLHELRFASLLSGGQTGGLLSNLLFLVVFAGVSIFVTPTLKMALYVSVGTMLAALVVGAFALMFTARDRFSSYEVWKNAQLPRLGFRTLLGMCLPLMLVQCVTFAALQADLWIAGAEAPHDQLALYGAARRLMLVIVMPLQMVNFLVMGSIAELKVQGRLQDLERLLRQTAGVAAVPSIMALCIMLVAGRPILEIVFGGFYSDAALPLAFLCVGQMVLTWAGSSHCALLMTGHQNSALAVNSVAAAALILAGSVAIRHFGITGLAASTATVVAIENIVLVLLARKLVGVWTHVSFPSLGSIQRLMAFVRGRGPNPPPEAEVLELEREESYAE